MRWLVAVLLGALLMAGCAGDGDGNRALRVGLVADSAGWGEAACEEQRRAKDAGARWLREEISWPEVEPEPGRLNWSRYDRVFDCAARNGLQVLPMILGNPEAEDELTIPEDPDAFAAFTARVVERYGPEGTFWRDRDDAVPARWFELWNEPQVVDFSAGGVAPERYARLVQAAVRAGRAARDEARFLVAAEILYYAPDGTARPWISALHEAVPDFGRYVDGIAVHPYTDGSPRVRTDRAIDGFGRVDEVVRQFAAEGTRDKPVWITEVGWSTCSARPDCVSPDDQARFVGELLETARDNPRIAAVFLYHLRDSGSDDEREERFGLLDRDGRPKPAYDAFRRASQT